MAKHSKNMHVEMRQKAARIIAMMVIGTIGLGGGVSTTSVSAVTDAASDTVAQSSVVTTNTQNQQARSATAYRYNQISMNDAYVYFTTASFIALAGLILYGSSYLLKQENALRSQYVSRYYDYAKTTY